jgi:hypothetical protein
MAPRGLQLQEAGEDYERRMDQRGARDALWLSRLQQWTAGNGLVGHAPTRRRSHRLMLAFEGLLVGVEMRNWPRSRQGRVGDDVGRQRGVER